MTRAEWTPKSLSADQAPYGTMKNASQTKTDAFASYEILLFGALRPKGLQDGVNIRKQRPDLEVILTGDAIPAARVAMPCPYEMSQGAALGAKQPMVP